MRDIDSEIELLSHISRKPSIAGRLWYFMFHYPKLIMRDGYAYRLNGFFAKSLTYKSILLDKQKTKSNAISYDKSDVSVNYLVGKNYTLPFLCSAISLRKNLSKNIKLNVFDDGTLRPKDKRLILSINDISANIIDFDCWAEIWRPYNNSIIARIMTFYPHIKKLMISKFVKGYSILSDCDILYLGECSDLRTKIQNKNLFYIEDKNEYYGASRSNEIFSKSEIKHKVNAGYYSFISEKIDYDKIEFFCRLYLEKVGFNYLLEQYLTALLLSDSDAVPLDPTYAMAAYENIEYGQPNMLHYANTMPAFYIDFRNKFLK